jgi:antitoxin component YwqK of YwqJK toxin-antitoxin module
MENFQEVKASIVEQAKAKKACSDQLKRAIDAQTWDELQEVIYDNIYWCTKHNIELPDGYYKNTKKEFIVVNGKVHGEYISYQNNGQVDEKCTYVHGQRHGEFVSYWNNGQVWVKCNYVDGKLNGEFVSYYEDGEVNVKFNYFDGKPHGEYVRYYKNGKVNVKFNYIYGQLIKTVC